MRESIDRLVAGRRLSPKVVVACSSFLQAAELVRTGVAAAALPDTALPAIQGPAIHTLRLPEQFALCLAWTARNADTRPALAGLLAAMQETMRL